MSTEAGFELLERHPRVPLAHLPTPIEPLPRLGRELGGPEIHVKRDDCTGLALGGNKVRKLEYLLGAALAAGADTIVTGGVVQSNHVRQTVAAAARLGLRCHVVVLEGRVPGTPPEYADSGNALLTRILGAELEPHPYTPDKNALLAEVAGRLARDRGWRPFVVPYGGSNAVGALGYVRCALEIATQTATAEPYDVLLHASGSCGTQAGLLVGAAVAGLSTTVVGVDIDAEAARIRREVAELRDATAVRLGLPDGAALPPVVVAEGFSGPAYGVVDDATVEAIELAGRLEGLVLDPVYSGKALAALIAQVRDGRLAGTRRVLLLHTGGSPGLFAYTSTLLERIAPPGAGPDAPPGRS